MSLDRLINVTVTKQTRTPTQQGFGTLMLLTSHSVAGSDVQTFANLAEAETAGFTAAAEPFNHNLLSKAFAQNPGPTRVKVGRRTNVSAQSVQLIPTDLTEGVVYNLTVNGEAAAAITNGASQTVATWCDAATTAINNLTGAGSDVSATDNTTHVTVAAGTASKRFYMTGLENVSVDDVTTDGGIATDLAAIAAIDSDWYGLVTDAHGILEICAADGSGGVASWAEANSKLYVPDSSDSDVKDSGSTTDTASELQDNSWERTGLIFSKGDYANGRGAGWIAGKLTEDPMAVGSTRKRTWAHYTISGSGVYDLTEGEKDTIEAKNATHYTEYGGLNMTFEGATASQEFLDIPQFIDAFVARLQESVVRLFATTDVRFDGEGQAALEGTIWAIVQQGIDAKAIAVSPDPQVFVPIPLDVPVADRANRVWTGITIDFRYTGGVHSANVHVNLTV